MSHVDRILVGLDEDRFADSAVIAAMHLSRLVDAPLEIVHTVPLPTKRPWFSHGEKLASLQAEVTSESRTRCVKHLHNLLTRFATTPSEIEDALHVTLGRPSAVLSERANANDIVVLGSHRSRGVLDFGGTTREMLSHPPCPIWVQDSRPWSEIRRILVALDLSPASGSVLSMAWDLAVTAGADITALHCFEPMQFPYVDEAKIAKLNAELHDRAHEEFIRVVGSERANEPRLETRFEPAGVASTVCALGSEHDLIVMGTHGHSTIGRAVIGSDAYRVLQQTEKPVLIVPQPRVEALGTP